MKQESPPADAWICFVEFKTISSWICWMFSRQTHLTWLISKPSGQGKVMQRFILGNSSTVLGVYFSAMQEDCFHVFEPITGSKDKTLTKLPVLLISVSEMAKDTWGNGNLKIWNKINNDNSDNQQSVTRWLTSLGNATKCGEAAAASHSSEQIILGSLHGSAVTMLAWNITRRFLVTSPW